ncbi:integrase, catalytic region, zinc finger, CCHC-type containing protein [Tanacetum coccineum]
MLDKTDFASWQQRIRLYCRGKENEVNILKSIDEGPFQMGTFRETLAEGNEGALHLGLPKDIYSLINHYIDAKNIWGNVNMLLEGSKLTKEDRKSQLYDDFEHFRQHKEETIHDYYVLFSKLINDIRNIKMTMSRMQLNSKFVNNMLPKWGRFVTAVKLNRGLRDSNYDQLYAYLKQHEAHANENKMMLEQFTQPNVDPLALMSNVSHEQVGNANTSQARQVKCYNCNGISHIARNCTQPKRPQNSEYFKDKMLLMQAQENGVALDEEQLLFIAGGQDNAVDEDVDEQPVQDLALNVDNMFQADDCDAFNSDVDEAPIAQTMFMTNLSSVDLVYDEVGPSYDSDVPSKVHDNDHYQDVVCEHHEIHEMHDDVQPNYVVDSHVDYTSDTNMIPYDQYIKENTVPVHEAHVNENKMLLDRFTQHTVDPLALISNVAPQKYNSQSSTNPSSTYVPPHFNRGQGNNARGIGAAGYGGAQNRVGNGTGAAGYGGAQNRVGNANPGQARQIKCYNCNGIGHITRNCNQPKRPQNSEYFKDKMLLMQAQENGVALDEEQLVFIADVDEAPTAQTMFMANLSSVDLVYDEVVPSMIQTSYPEDLIKMKAEALKEQTTASRPIKALTVYPPNTPATLIITPTGLTEGERGFEQTKECYLTEVIPFFKTLKEHFEGIQKALTKEIKEMKDIFEELEAEVDQNVIHRKHAEIERKNLLIANDNLIVDCLSKDVFYITTNSELIVSIFTEMHDAHTIVQARCLELEVELSKLRDKIQTDDHNELVNRFSNIEITQLTEKVTTLQEQNELFRAENEKIKQHYKELYDFIKITRAKHIEQTTNLLTENENLKVQIHNKMQCVTTNPIKPRVLALGKYAIDVEPIPPHNRNNRKVHLDYLKHLKESVETIREIVEEAKVERPLDRSLASACLYTKHSQELLEYVIGTCPKDFNQRNKKHANTPLTKKKQVTFEVQCATSNSNTHKYVEQLNTQKTNVPMPPSAGVNSCTDASGSQPRSNTKKNRILPAKSVNKKNVE